MDSLGQALDNKLRNWQEQVAREVRARVKEIIDRADDDTLDISRSRAVEQEVLDSLDEPSSR